MRATIREDVMVYRVAVNGFGRIGRNYLRATLERGILGHGNMASR